LRGWPWVSVNRPDANKSWEIDLILGDVNNDEDRGLMLRANLGPHVNPRTINQEQDHSLPKARVT
jgi:hypothetical protein